MHSKLLKVFAGYQESHVQFSLTEERTESGKVQAKYVTVKKPVTADIWKQHLEGKIRIGIRPEHEGKCSWSCIDVDPANYKDYSQKKYVDIIAKYKLPLVPVLSKSGGLHIFVFFNKPYSIQKVKDKLCEINEQYFLANEVYPCNKTINMPYCNHKRTREFAYDDENYPLSLERFLEEVENKTVDPEEFCQIEVKENEIESDWSHYPPCVQKLIQEGWSGNNRHQFLYNVVVLEIKKQPSISLRDLETLILQRNIKIFTKPLPEQEVRTMVKSIHKEGYGFQCPPKHIEYQVICNKELCKTRKLGTGDYVPDIIDDFTDIAYIQDTKNTFYEFTFKDKHVSVTPEDMKDEKSWRVKLLRYRIYWLTLPKPRKGPSPFELLMKGIVEKSVESKEHAYVDTLEEERYLILKDFFENHIEQDKFDKLKDSYIVLDSKTNVCYFKKYTLDRFLKKNSTKAFNNTQDALRVLGCKRKDYHEGEKNVWYVEMPEFVRHESVKKEVVKEKVTEMDDEYHSKFRTAKAKADIQKNH